jgi:hypothetical protein
MKKQLFFLLILCVMAQSGYGNAFSMPNPSNPSNEVEAKVLQLSQKLNINTQALRLALNGYEKLKSLGRISNLRFLTIADFSKPSNENRLYVIDLFLEQVVVQTLVAHGKKSGTLFANIFSNKTSSHKSSLGFYVTGNIYNGRNGASLELNGMESGINDHAKNRSIVIHGADYVSNRYIQQQGYIGRSQGCPAVPNDQLTNIIDAIQGASCMFVYAPNKAYLQKSNFTH